MSPKLPIGMSGLDACVVGFSGEGCYQIVTKYGHTASDQSYKWLLFLWFVRQVYIEDSTI